MKVTDKAQSQRVQHDDEYADGSEEATADFEILEEHHVHGAGCVMPSLPDRLLGIASEVAARINPVNAPFTQAFMPGGAPEIALLAVLTQKYWGRQRRRLTVSFMEATPADLKARILSHMNAWNIGVTFAQTGGVGQVRISRSGQGYWSYLGTDVLLIPRNRPTMNLQGFTMNTAESEYKRVVRHETGHTLGFPHEHLRRQLVHRLDVAKTIAWFRQRYGWDEATTRSNVLTPLEESSIRGTLHADQDSIMAYQLPGAITKDGQPIRGGLDINALDRAFARSIYPPVGFTPSAAADTAWGEDEDVTLSEALAAADA